MAIKKQSQSSTTLYPVLSVVRIVEMKDFALAHMAVLWDAVFGNAVAPSYLSIAEEYSYAEFLAALDEVEDTHSEDHDGSPAERLMVVLAKNKASIN